MVWDGIGRLSDDGHMPMIVRLTTLLLLLVALLAPAAVLAEDDLQPPPDAEPATVVSVTAGDSIRVLLADGTEQPVRYIGIETPEPGNDEQEAEPYGPRAAAANVGFVADQTVLLERDVSDTDPSGALLRYVWVETEDGWVMVNERLVALGLAEVHADEPDTAHREYLLESEEQARFTGRGMHDAEAVARAVVGAEAMAYLFMDAYDARDTATLRQLMSRDVVYRLPTVRVEGRRNVMTQFREEWSARHPVITIRGSVAQPDAAVLELTVLTTEGEDPGTVEVVGIQRWEDDQLVHYRIYRDE